MCIPDEKLFYALIEVVTKKEPGLDSEKKLQDYANRRGDDSLDFGRMKKKIWH